MSILVTFRLQNMNCTVYFNVDRYLPNDDGFHEQMYSMLQLCYFLSKNIKFKHSLPIARISKNSSRILYTVYGMPLSLSLEI
jgi:hypothetical protein